MRDVSVTPSLLKLLDESPKFIVGRRHIAMFFKQNLDCLCKGIKPNIIIDWNGIKVHH